MATPVPDRQLGWAAVGLALLAVATGVAGFGHHVGALSWMLQGASAVFGGLLLLTGLARALRGRS